MAEFAYNNMKNASTGYISFEINCGYYPGSSYEEDIESYSKSKFADKILIKLRKLIAVCRNNL